MSNAGCGLCLRKHQRRRLSKKEIAPPFPPPCEMPGSPAKRPRGTSEASLLPRKTPPSGALMRSSAARLAVWGGHLLALSGADGAAKLVHEFDL